jgi:ribonuclease G
MSGKLIITKTNWMQEYPDAIFSGLYNDSGFYQIHFSSNSKSDLNVGDILVGRVRDIVKNLNAAFIEIQPGVTGYFSIDENPSPIFLNRKNTNKICQGDLVLVQIKKAAVKTKAPVLTAKISLTGKYLVLIGNDSGISVSNKISDKNIRTELKQFMETSKTTLDTAVIIRTNAQADVEQKWNAVQKELQDLELQWEELKKYACHRPAFYLMKEAEPEYLRQLKGAYKNEIKEILTDDVEIHRTISDYLEIEQLQTISLVQYTDALLPLYKLYSLETVIKRVLSKHVWLKSGAYLVIEPTEAMVVIDVNTGKCQKGKNPEETMLRVNKEAAKEIAMQLQLRNLSGIIVIDFINMEEEKSQEQLIEALKQYIQNDKIKTNFVELTKLNLVLLTRKKTEAPIYEQLERL